MIAKAVATIVVLGFLAAYLFVGIVLWGEELWRPGEPLTGVVLFLSAYALGLFFLVFLCWKLFTHRGPLPVSERGQIVVWDLRRGTTTIWPGEEAYLARRGFNYSERTLLGDLHHPDTVVRVQAREAMRRMGPRILPMLRSYSREENQHWFENDRGYREEVLDLIGELHPGGLVAGLVEGLESGDLHEEWQVCNCLRDLGDRATEAVPPLSAFVARGGLNASRGITALTYIGEEGERALLALAMDPAVSDDLAEDLAIAVRDGIGFGSATLAREFMGLIRDAGESAGSTARTARLASLLRTVTPESGGVRSFVREISRTPEHALAAVALEVLHGPPSGTPDPPAPG